MRNALVQPESSAGPPRILVSGAGKHYGTLHVFRDVNLAVGRREIVSIVGASGCGKTTLLRCLDGLIPMTEGRILFDGAEVKGPPPKMAMVFQHFGLFPWKTVRGNVAYGLALQRTSRAEMKTRVPEVIHLVGLDGFEDAYPYQLSGGMQQRCGLARALSVDPDVLLLDEPFAAIDAQTREILQFELLRIFGLRPTTMIFVTHSIEEAVLMGDRVVVLKGRPSTVTEVVEVTLPRPRTRETLASPRFAELREHVWKTLMDEARRAEFRLGGPS